MKKLIVKKSQLAMEFVLLFGFLMILVAFTLVFIYDINKEKVEEKIEKKMSDFSYSVQSEIVMAHNMNNGYKRILYLPEKIERTDYNITILERNLVLSYNGLSFYYKIPIVNGTLNKGKNTIYKQNNTVYILNYE